MIEIESESTLSAVLPGRSSFCTSEGSGAEGLRRPSADGYSLRIRRTAPDWPGREAVTARMQKAGGPSCRLTATF